MSSLVRLLAPLLALASLGSTAHALSASRTHDGFLLRLNIGLGYENLSLSDATSDFEIGGLGAALSVGIGGLIAPDLALQAELFGSAVVSPGVSRDGVDLGDAIDASVSLSGIGGGVTYWLMPANIYVMTMLGFAKATIEEDGFSVQSDWGFALQGMVGVEFWVDDEWGLGFAGQLLWANVPTDRSSISSSFMAVNLLFSATYN